MEVYKNSYCKARYVYARPYTTSITSSADPRIDEPNPREHVDVYLVGVPDGVSPTVYEALVPVDAVRRLYLYSNKRLPEKWLSIADASYGERPYPLLTLETPCARDCRTPVHNFYTALADRGNEDVYAAAVSRRQDAAFVEYRYVEQRHAEANIYYDEFTNSAYRLALPADSAQLVLIMPSNFIRTDLKRGYFIFDDIDLIVRVYSKHLLSADRTSDDGAAPLASDVCTGNRRVMDIVRSFFSRMGVQSVYAASDNQIIGYDRYLTLVVGDVSNISY